MAHKPPSSFRSLAKLHLKRHKTEDTLAETLDDKVGLMRWLGLWPPNRAQPHAGNPQAQGWTNAHVAARPATKPRALPTKTLQIPS